MSNLTSKQWEEKKGELIRAIPKVISQYKSGEELTEAVAKWQGPIITAALGYTFEEPFFETHSQARNTLCDLQAKYLPFKKAYNDLGNYARLCLNSEGEKLGLNDIERYIVELEDSINSALKDLDRAIKLFKKENLNVAKTGEARVFLLCKLFSVYEDISGHKKLTLSTSDAKGTIGGSLYEFICPILDIFYKNENPNTRKSTIEKAKIIYQKLHKQT